MTTRDTAPPALPAAQSPRPPQRTTLPIWAAYLIALLLAGGAVALGLFVLADAITVALFVCLVAVIVSAWLGGVGPGLLAAVSGVVVGGVLPATPTRSAMEALAETAVYIIVALFVVGIGAALRQAERAHAAALTDTAARIAQSEQAAREQANSAIAASEQRAEAAIATSARSFRTLLAHSADAFVLLDGSGTVRFASPAASRLLQYDFERAQNASLASLVHRDDTAPFHTLLTESREAALRFWAGDGWRWIEATRSDLRDDPDVRALLVNLRDVTAQMRTEERHAFLRDALQQFLVSDLNASAFAAVAGVAVPRFAAGCAVELAGEGGALHRAFTALPPGLLPDAPDPFAAAVVSVHVVRALVTRRAAAFGPTPDASRTLLVAPLAARGETLGAVTFAAGEGGAFDADDETTATLFAGYLALALASVRPANASTV